MQEASAWETSKTDFFNVLFSYNPNQLIHDMGQYLVLVLKTQLTSIPITSLIVPLLGSRGTTHVLVESVT